MTSLSQNSSSFSRNHLEAPNRGWPSPETSGRFYFVAVSRSSSADAIASGFSCGTKCPAPATIRLSTILVIVAPGPVKTPIWSKGQDDVDVARYANSPYLPALQKVSAYMQRSGCRRRRSPRSCSAP